MKVLHHNNVEVEHSYAGCCGMPYLEQADLDQVTKQAELVSRELIKYVEKGYKVVTLTASCGLMLKFEWPLLLSNNEDIKKLFKKMMKQRAESIEIYKKNNRSDLLEVEQNEYDILSSFLPKQLNEEDTKKICEETISKLGANSVKDMGKVMGELKKQHADEIDFSKAGALIKQLLNK